MTWRATVLTLFPDAFPGPLGALARRSRPVLRPLVASTQSISETSPPTAIAPSMTPRSAAAPAWCCAPTSSTAAIARYRPGTDDRPLLCLTPRGMPFTQSDAAPSPPAPAPSSSPAATRASTSASSTPAACSEISIGDYVLSGGELPALVVLDACIRLLPGVMGTADSAIEESLHRRPAGIPALHPPRRLAGPRRAPSPALRPPRRGRRLAPRARPNAPPALAAPTCGRGTPQPHTRRRLPAAPPRRNGSRTKGPPR